MFIMWLLEWKSEELTLAIKYLPVLCSDPGLWKTGTKRISLSLYYGVR